MIIGIIKNDNNDDKGTNNDGDDNKSSNNKDYNIQMDRKAE